MEQETTNFRAKYSDREEWKEVVYDLMNGVYDLERYPMEESKVVQDEFATGMFCEQTYEDVYAAKQRLYKRLGTREDADVELIIAKLMEIGRHLAMKMYDYGEVFSEE